MIGKITTGRGAGGTVAYVTGKDGAQILSSTWTGSPEGWAAQFKEHSEALNPGLTEHGQSVVHVSLNAAPGEHLTDDQWRAVAETYLERMGWGGHDHAVVRHTDTSHDHVHIIVSRVGHDGQTADLHNDFPRQERVLGSIERDFGLERTHEQIRREAEKDPYRAVESVTRNNLTFERANIDRYFERLGFETDKAKQLTDQAMRDDRVLFASTTGASDKFTTTTVVAEVQRLDSALRSLDAQEARPTLDRGEFGREGLSDGQRAAADRIAAGGGLTVVEGFAGAGKSTMLRVAAEDLRFSGHDVIGVAPSGKAAKGLQDSARIESNTLTRTLMDIERGDKQLTANSVVVVDEAGMARNDELGRLAQQVADARGRLVLVGDDKQLGAVGRGGGFAEAREIAGGRTARLDEIFRQREGWQRDASQAFGEGRAREAIQSHIDHGRVEWAASRGTARNMLVSDYVRELDRGTKAENMLALAHENRDVKAINSEIRDAIKERGGLQNERTYKLEGEDGKTQKIGIAAGDRVVFEKNTHDANGKEVKNGEFGTVSKVDSRGFSVRMDDGSSRRVEDGARQQMSYGYASSIHKSQGATVDKTHVLASRGMDSKLTYVSMSRQREDTKLYANTTEFKSAGHLNNCLSRDGGREAFKSVLSAGDGKERAQSRATDRGHAAGARPAGENAAVAREVERERQPVNAYIAAAAMDQRKVETGLLSGKQHQQHSSEAQGQQEKGQERQAGQARQEQDHGKGQQGRENQTQAQPRQQEKGQGQQPVWREQGKEQVKNRQQGRADKQSRQGQGGECAQSVQKDRGHAAGARPAGERAQGQGKSQAQTREADQRHQEKAAPAKDPRQTPGQSQAGKAQEKAQSKAQGKTQSSKSKGYGL